MSIMEWFGALAIVFVSMALVMYLFVKQRYSYWERKGVPFEPPTFPYGNMKGVDSEIHFSKWSKNIYDKLKSKGKFVGIYLLIQPVVLLTDLDLIKNVLIKDFNKFTDRGLYYNEECDPLSAHLISLDGAKWKALRSKMSQTFTSGKMKFMFPTIVEVTNRFRECLTVMLNDGKDVIEISEMLYRFLTDVIGTCAFGIECKSLENPDAEFCTMGRSMIDKPRHGLISGFFLSTCKTFAKFFRMKAVRDDVSAFFMKIVNDTIDYREKNNIKRNDFMDILIGLKNQKENELTVNEIAAQAFVIFLAGFETSATTLTYSLYELAMNKDIQDKARQQIRAVIEKHNGQFTYEAMIEMTFVEQIINETLRKYTTVSIIVRQACADYKVPDTDIVIEKGTPVWISPYVIHHDPEYYPEPDKFMPERFSAERVAERESFKWLPFGDGPRNCIGSRFGMMQMMIGLSTLLNCFEFSVCDQTTVPLKFSPKGFILKTEGGIYLKLQNLQN